MVTGYSLRYNYLPYAVSNKSGEIIGEIYLGVESEVIESIRNIELNAGYREINYQAQIIENFPVRRSIDIIMYEYPHDIRGKEMRTMLFGEAFHTSNGITYYDHREYYSTIKGNMRILITVLHGGYYRPLNLSIRCQCEADEETFELAREVITHIYWLSRGTCIPSAVLGRIHRSRVDFNYAEDFYELSIAQEYHNRINKLLSKDETLLIDIHGMSEYNKYDVEIGTLFGKAAYNREDIIEAIVSVMEKAGLNVCIDKKFYGGFTIKKYGGKRGTIAIQIEINKRLRTFDSYKKTAKILAEAIWEAWGTMSYSRR